ncbi:hypothetical protein TEQG_08862 [Trichophyton equinum CBS 127.97]|uniref:Uncharacterized protein n=1 Tax=Trichophyton equinum (strain ATCC MYA-4606 / CBS 127.97) TaxID=559882 RepID=F2Q630_TRIEC|nr:hypothetical protein TEQG_08862 [Trichophyton equinum CBS 127.97]
MDPLAKRTLWQDGPSGQMVPLAKRTLWQDGPSGQMKWTLWPNGPSGRTAPRAKWTLWPNGPSGRTAPRAKWSLWARRTLWAIFTKWTLWPRGHGPPRGAIWGRKKKVLQIAPGLIQACSTVDLGAIGMHLAAAGPLWTLQNRVVPGGPFSRNGPSGQTDPLAGRPLGPNGPSGRTAPRAKWTLWPNGPSGRTAPRAKWSLWARRTLWAIFTKWTLWPRGHGPPRGAIWGRKKKVLQIAPGLIQACSTVDLGAIGMHLAAAGPLWTLQNRVVPMV